MAILSKRIMQDVDRAYHKACGLRAYFTDISGAVVNRADDRLAAVSGLRRRRDYALQESINQGQTCVFMAVPGVSAWILGLEDHRMIHGGLLGGEVRVAERGGVVEHLAAHGLDRALAAYFVDRLPEWPEEKVREAAGLLQETFYQISGWNPELMKENRLKILQQQQINQAIEDQRKKGLQALYAFDKERALLANIRAGDRKGARSILNEMLATIYMSSPQLVVLRARAIELMTCLTRAAIEDNPLLEPLIERNHSWTERLVRARSFEDLSQVLMDALDDFMDGIYIHGLNRSNTKVRRALDFIGANFMKRVSLQALSREVGLSPGRLSHLVKDLTGRTVLQIVQQVRIRHAQHLLERTAKSCTEVAYEVGFGDQSYFIKHFRRLTGTTPARYRRSRHAPVEDEGR